MIPTPVVIVLLSVVSLVIFVLWLLVIQQSETWRPFADGVYKSHTTRKLVKTERHGSMVHTTRHYSYTLTDLFLAGEATIYNLKDCSGLEGLTEGTRIKICRSNYGRYKIEAA